MSTECETTQTSQGLTLGHKFRLFLGAPEGVGTAAMQTVYWISAGSTVFLILYQVFSAILGDEPTPRIQSVADAGKG